MSTETVQVHDQMIVLFGVILDSPGMVIMGISGMHEAVFWCLKQLMMELQILMDE
jgi:hypothetical protein